MRLPPRRGRVRLAAETHTRHRCDACAPPPGSRPTWCSCCSRPSGPRDGLTSLREPLLDIGRARAGDGLVAIGGTLGLSPQSVTNLALALAGMKLMLAACLILAVATAAFETARRRVADDAMLDVGVFLSAAASAIAAVPVLVQGGVPLQAALGELLLCAIASGLALWGRGRWRRRRWPRRVGTARRGARESSRRRSRRAHAWARRCSAGACGLALGPPSPTLRLAGLLQRRVRIIPRTSRSDR
ncbi:MAG: hypothetical protein M5U07_25605 [Xanthobacteraceae bacterium]|nr:hypothetical protein [Xanthobacteraceae bacterium]